MIDALGTTLFWGVLLLLPFIFIPFILAALRGDHDEKGNRAYSVYLAAVSAVALYVLIVSLYTVVGGVLTFTEKTSGFTYPKANSSIGSDPTVGSSDFYNNDNQSSSDDKSYAETHDINGAWQMVVGGLIGTATGGALLLWHRKRMKALAAAAGYTSSAGERVINAYNFIVCAAGAIMVLGSVSLLAYSIFQLVSPSVFGAGDRGEVLRTMVRTTWVAILGAWLWELYRRPTMMPGVSVPKVSIKSSSSETPAE